MSEDKKAGAYTACVLLVIALFFKIMAVYFMWGIWTEPTIEPKETLAFIFWCFVFFSK